MRVNRLNEIDQMGTTYDLVLGVIRVKVNTADEHRSIGGGSGDDDFLGTSLQVSRCSKKERR